MNAPFPIVEYLSTDRVHDADFALKSAADGLIRAIQVVTGNALDPETEMAKDNPKAIWQRAQRGKSTAAHILAWYHELARIQGFDPEFDETILDAIYEFAHRMEMFDFARGP